MTLFNSNRNEDLHCDNQNPGRCNQNERSGITLSFSDNGMYAFFNEVEKIVMDVPVATQTLAEIIARLIHKKATSFSSRIQFANTCVLSKKTLPHISMKKTQKDVTSAEQGKYL